MKRGAWVAGAGAISLVLVFAVLSLAVFAVLTVSTANSERILIEKMADSVKDYYNADTLAVKIRAELISQYQSSGALPDVIMDTEIETYTDGDINGENADAIYIRYACPQGNNQEISVTLMFSGDNVSVLSWKSVSTEDWSADFSIDIWDGE